MTVYCRRCTVAVLSNYQLVADLVRSVRTLTTTRATSRISGRYRWGGVSSGDITWVWMKLGDWSMLSLKKIIHFTTKYYGGFALFSRKIDTRRATSPIWGRSRSDGVSRVDDRRCAWGWAIVRLWVFEKKESLWHIWGRSRREVVAG